MSLPRGVRNNNPGNIRLGDEWKGMADEQTDRSFCVFISPEYGIRAATKILLGYQERYGCWDVEKIIHRWAPPVENDTGAYVNAVAQAVGVSPTETLSLRDPEKMRAVLKAIFHHENGGDFYSDATVAAGVKLAGIA